jgi:hypothetical protein
MFFPATKGYLLFAHGRREKAASDAQPKTRKENMLIDTPKEEYRWHTHVPIRVQAMVATGENLFIAGPPDVIAKDDPLGAFEGRKGGLLWVFSKADGKELAEYKLDSPPVWDGMAAAGGQLIVALRNGRLVCFGQRP